VRKHTIIFTSTFACWYSHPIFWIEPDEEICQLRQWMCRVPESC
jgi:hypothetical protein